jgi:hypothetical protein
LEVENFTGFTAADNLFFKKNFGAEFLIKLDSIKIKIVEQKKISYLG